MINKVVDAEAISFFDEIIKSDKIQDCIGANNLVELIYSEFSHRKEDDIILIGNVEGTYTEVSLKKLRSVIFHLVSRFREKGIQPGDHILLGSFETNNELYTAILFISLSVLGVNVLLPMYMDRESISNWHRLIPFNLAIFPLIELNLLKDSLRQKENAESISKQLIKLDVEIWDTLEDLGIANLLQETKAINQIDIDKFFGELKSVNTNDIVLSTTTSGTTGSSKIVQYDTTALLKNISSWKQAGLLDDELLGGSSFTPLFTHTMGIRTFLNAIYCGKPTIIIPISWFEQKPEVARYFIEKGKPRHITGGPGVFRTLLEMSRVFLSLKDSLRKNLKIVVSSGSSMDVELMMEVKEAFSVQVFNAFGSSENQQVINTALDPDNIAPCLSGLLPGVHLGLVQSPLKDNLYRLYIKSEFGCSFILQSEKQISKNNYLYLGDLVTIEPEGIMYKGREQTDYIKDSFGVKIPLEKVLGYYPYFKHNTDYIKLLPLGYQPGLAALIFISSKDDESLELDYKDKIKNYLTSRNLELFSKLPPLDYSHRVIRRFALLNSAKFKNRKGLVAEKLIHEHCPQLLAQLVNEHFPSENIVDIKDYSNVKNDFEQYHNPYLGKLMKALYLDKTYLSGYGDYLYTSKNLLGEKYLDLTGGYGTNLLGHSNKEIFKHARNFFGGMNIPLSNQFSIRKYSGKLAKKLNQVLFNETNENFIVLFGSTGTEIVEMAIHHAYLEWKKNYKKLKIRQYRNYSGKYDKLLSEIWEENQKVIDSVIPCIITNSCSYHGGLSNARTLNGIENFSADFLQLSGIKRLVLDDRLSNLEYRLQNVLKENHTKLKVLKYHNREVIVEYYSFSNIIGSILEPIKGEGGIQEIIPKLPRLLSSLPFPLIFDEIQSGLGRSGSFLASKPVIGDYYLFAKALGGNVAKISALAIDRNRYIEKFGKKVVSTFGGGGFETYIALKTLKIIERDNVPGLAFKIGKMLKSALNSIVTEYPQSFESVDGRGLMLGIKLRITEDSGLFRILHEKKVLGYLVASYLLNRFTIRMLPSLAAPSVLRIEPSVNFEKASLDYLLTALRKLGQVLESKDLYELSKHLMDGDLYNETSNQSSLYGPISTKEREPAKNAKRVAFVGHFVNPSEELRMLSPSLIQASETGLLKLFQKLQLLLEMEPFILNSENVFSGRVHLNSLIVPLSTASLEKLHRTGKRSEVIEKIQEAVNLAANKGALFISLGGYNSIITDNGLKVIEPKGTRVVTGNTLTAVVGYQSFQKMVREHFAPTQPLTFGIVGSTGNIGRIFSQNLVSEDLHPKSRIILFGRNLTLLKNLKNAIQPDCKVDIEIRRQLDEIKECDAVFVSVNTNDPILYKDHFANNKKVVIFDVSIPSGVSDQIIREPNIIYKKHGASIVMPEDPDLLVTSCSPPGTALCCVYEALLCGLEKIHAPLRGKITIEGFNEVKQAASKYGLLEEFGEQKPFVKH